MEECKPLYTLKEVLAWEPKEDWARFVLPIKPRSEYSYAGSGMNCHKRFNNPVKLLRSHASKTLLCHDMKGGYLDDKYVSGTAYKNQYLFFQWSAIDTFVYFSHKFVTIPPLMWINAAHNNGVKMLGTLITEFAEGSKICKEILGDEKTLDLFVSKLIRVCEHYNFDGYLINIENRISSRHIPKLVELLKRLKAGLKGRMVIWYDSVSLLDGELKWQNELNEHNEKAFQICDGIFLNYGWTRTTLENSMLRAGSRQYDVYVGVDVWGRGCYGGGKFNTDKAVKVSREVALSVAIFGFGWTHESSIKGMKFFEVERMFWAKIWPHLYIHVPNSIPFATTFNPGIGRTVSKKSGYGSEKWYDLSVQDCQLSMPSCLDKEKKVFCMQIYLKDSFFGGSCLILQKHSEKVEIHRLLFCDFKCTVEKLLTFSITVKWLKHYSPFMLRLTIEGDSRKFAVLLPISKEIENKLISRPNYSYSLDLSNKILSTKSREVLASDWISNIFTLKFSGRITEISAVIETPVLVGLLSLK